MPPPTERGDCKESCILNPANEDKASSQNLAWEVQVMSRWFLLGGLMIVLAQPARADDEKDPFLWLEDVSGKKALDWVKEQNAHSAEALTKTEAFTELKDRLLKILDSKERIPFVSKAGPHYYNFWRDATNKR